MIVFEKKLACLILEDGTRFNGISLGKQGITIGEIVFTTSMTGYLETLTDPSYYGQIVTQTFPSIGNYGTNIIDCESKMAWPFGYIVRDCCKTPSSFRNTESLDMWLKKNNVIAIEGIDTRYLTKKIRKNGVINGAITTEKIENSTAFLEKIKNFKITNAVENITSINKVNHYGEFTKFENCNRKKPFKICVIDFGVKKTIVENLVSRTKEVTVLPYNTSAEKIKQLDADGIVLSNGPGNPKENKKIIKNLKDIINLNIPIFGICLGHQLLALATGAETEKLKFGHRGTNHPVIETKTGKITITSQNHGYVVVKNSLDSNICYISHLNVNDRTCEGIAYRTFPAFSVQFHPEGAAGPVDSNFLFDRFFSLVEFCKNKSKGKNCYAFEL